VSDATTATAEWQRHRGYLLGVAYRITGSLADAEDAVQDAWLRFQRLDADRRAELRDVRAWLTTVVARLCLDRVRSAAARRERYVGPWLPDPIVTTVDGGPDPLDEVVQGEDVRMAAMIVLQELSPPQRVAFVLHDSCGLPFDEIGEILGCTAVTARQHASRGRRALADAKLPAREEIDEQRRVLTAFLAALSSGDTDAVVRLLHPDVVSIGDGGGKAPAARRPVHGAAAVAQLLSGLTRLYPEIIERVEPVLVNGELGVAVRGPIMARSGQRLSGAALLAVVSNGRIVRVYNVVNPDKLPASWAS
jgi:RNA polymerase sigma-70 factor (ECF subfamily)